MAVWQSVSVNPAAQVHAKPEEEDDDGEQVPPFWQGCWAHGEVQVYLTPSEETHVLPIGHGFEAHTPGSHILEVAL